MLKSLVFCEQKKLRYTTRDSLLGAAVMIVGTIIFGLQLLGFIGMGCFYAFMFLVFAGAAAAGQ